jgi:hypothetical protein
MEISDMETNSDPPCGTLNPAGATKLAARRHQGIAYTVWLDGPTRDRLARLHDYFAGNLCLRPTNSVVIRAALKALEERIVEGYSSAQLRDDLVAAAEARGVG